MNTDLMKRLRDQRLAAWEAAKAALDTADAEGRELSGDAETTYEAAIADVDRLDARIRELVDAETRAREIDEALDALPTPQPQPGPSNVADQIRALYRGEIREVEIPYEARDLTKAVATAGGNTVPTGFVRRLQEHMIEVSAVLNAGPTVLETTSGESIEVPVTTSYSTAVLTAEAAAIAESDPAVAKRTLGAYKYPVLVQVARELLDDTAVDLEGFIARQAGRAVGNALGTHLVTGTGSSQPAGVVTQSTLGKTGATGVTGAFNADDLIDLFYSVIAPYRNSPSCAWLMRDATLASVRKLKATNPAGTQGSWDYIWQPSLAIGAPDTILGKPAYTDPNVAAQALSARSVAFGDMAAYWVRLAGGVRFERSDEFAFGNDLVTFKCVVRGDGILADQTGAVKHFAGAGT